MRLIIIIVVTIVLVGGYLWLSERKLKKNLDKWVKDE